MAVACRAPEIPEAQAQAPSALAASEQQPAQKTSDSPDTDPLPATSSLPGWRTASPLEFETLLNSLPSRGDFDAALYDQLAAALADDSTPVTAVRAALLLARRDTAQADRVLLAQLEARHPHPSRPADAGDVVAAAHLATSPRAAALDAAPRLAALADGPGAHPDLEVRTECARSALLLGDQRVAPYLMRLVRLDTPLGLARDGAWQATQFTSWVRNRAAETLCEVLGMDCPYRADASLDQRETAAHTIEEAWAAAAQKSE